MHRSLALSAPKHLARQGKTKIDEKWHPNSRLLPEIMHRSLTLSTPKQFASLLAPLNRSLSYKHPPLLRSKNTSPGGVKQKQMETAPEQLAIARNYRPHNLFSDNA